MSRRLTFVTCRLTFMSCRLVFVTHRVMFMSHRIVFVMRRVQSVHTTNSERTLRNFFTILKKFLVMREIKFKMQFCNLAQLGLGNSTSFVISMYLFTIFHSLWVLAILVDFVNFCQFFIIFLSFY